MMNKLKPVHPGEILAIRPESASRVIDHGPRSKTVWAGNFLTVRNPLLDPGSS
jgi:hypothetical protein